MLRRTEDIDKMPRIVRIIPKIQDSYQLSDVEKVFFLTADGSRVNNEIIKFNTGISIPELFYAQGASIQPAALPPGYAGPAPDHEGCARCNRDIIESLLDYILGIVPADRQDKQYFQSNAEKCPHFHGDAGVSTVLGYLHFQGYGRIILNSKTYTLNSVGVDISFTGKPTTGKYGNLEFKYCLEKMDGSLDTNFQCVLNIHINPNSKKLFGGPRPSTIPILPKNDVDHQAAYRKEVRARFSEMFSKTIFDKLEILERLGIDDDFSHHGYALPKTCPAYDDYLKRRDLLETRRQANSHFWTVAFGVLGLSSLATLAYLAGPRSFPGQEAYLSRNAMTLFSGLGGAVIGGYMGHNYGRQMSVEYKP